MQLKFVVGDWSGDGHERSDEFLVDTNKDISTVDEYRKKPLIGLFLKEFSDYEQDTLSEQFHAVALDCGVQFPDIDYTSPLNGKEYLLTYFALVQYYDNSFTYEILEAPWGNTVNLGGYGLF